MLMHDRLDHVSQRLHTCCPPTRPVHS